MKKIIFVLIAVCMCSIVFAADQSIEIYSFKVFSDEDTISSDWDDDLFITNPGKTLQVQMILENNNDTSIEVSAEGILYLSENLKSSKKYTIEGKHRKTFIFEYYIPTDIKLSHYNYELSYSYTIPVNGSTEDVSKEFEVTMKEDKLTGSDLCDNLTRQLVDSRVQQADTQRLLANFTGLSEKYGQCQSELAAASSKANVSAEYEIKYNSVCTQRDNLTSLYAECDAQRKNLFTADYVKSAEVQAEIKGRESQKNIDNTTLYFVVIVAAGYFWYNKKQKKVGDDLGRDPLRKNEASFSTGSAWKMRK